MECLRSTDLPVGLSYIDLHERLKHVVPSNEKPKPATIFLARNADEIRLRIAGDNENDKPPMKAKTAWDVIIRRHDLTGKASYETFKRFDREHSLAEARPVAVPRIETEPGEEVQIDYGKAGMKNVSSRRRTIYAYCGILSCSRLPFMLFVLSHLS